MDTKHCNHTSNIAHGLKLVQFEMDTKLKHRATLLRLCLKLVQFEMDTKPLMSY